MAESTELPVRPRRWRWLSYSLGTLLLLTAIAAGVWGAWVNRAERQQRAVAAIRAMGGEVGYDFEFDFEANWQAAAGEPRGPFGLCKILGVDFCCDVVFVRMPYATTDAELIQLSAFANLQELDLSGTQMTGAGLVHLSKLKQLAYLHLNGTRATDIGLEDLSRFTNLAYLNLGATRVTDTGIAQLAKLAKLHYLVLDGSQVSDAGCNRFKKALPTCSISRFGEGHQWVLPGPLGRLQQTRGEG